MAVRLDYGLSRVWQLVVVGFVGLCLLIGGVYLESYETSWKLKCVALTLEGIGTAAFVAAVLAATIERWLLSDLAKDIVLTTFGHHLPQEYKDGLKAELIRLAGYNFFCEKQVLRLKLESIPDSTSLRLTTLIDKQIKNISRKANPIKGWIHVDDWGLEERSKITECKIEIDGSIVASLLPSEMLSNRSVLGRTEEIYVRPGKVAKITTESVEIVHRNDDISYFFGAPILNPVIDITEVPPELMLEYDFGTEEPITIEKAKSRRKQLTGIYFPLQRMRVHWWPKNDQESAKKVVNDA